MRPPAATCKRGHPASDSYVYLKLRWHKTEQRFVEYKCRQCRACRTADEARAVAREIGAALPGDDPGISFHQWQQLAGLIPGPSGPGILQLTSPTYDVHENVGSLTIGVVRRQTVIGALRDLGVRDVESRDPIEWERAIAARG